MNQKLKKGILQEKNCFITGATGGIGKEIARELASAKCNLFLTARDNAALKKLALSLEKEYKIKVGFFAGDLHKDSDIKKIIQSARKTFDIIDILINSAGIFDIKPLKESTLEDFEKSFSTNIRAPFIFSKAFSDDMVFQKWGRIVNIGSSSSYSGFSNTSIYCSSKHAILGLSRAINAELKKHNVRTFCVSPGSTNTKMGRKSVDQDYKTFINPIELAETVAFLISFDKEMVIDEIRLNRMIIQ